MAISGIRAATNTYVEVVQEEFNERYALSWPRSTVPTISVTFGPEYARIISDDGECFIAYSFIDMSNGDVLKPNGWKRPAKHARGNIFNADRGMTFVGEFWADYLR